MKYCGVVTDKSYYDESEIYSRSPAMDFIELYARKERRIYSDEVPMADEEMLSFIRWGRRLVFMNSQKAEKFIYWGSRIG